jgi:HEAT repeat protein
VASDPMQVELLRALEAEESGELDALVRSGNAAVLEALRAMVAETDVDRESRIRAIYALGRWRDQEAVDKIVAALPELDLQGRIAAVEALGLIGHPTGLPAVIAEAGSESPMLRKFAARALGRFDQSEARERLHAMEANDDADFVRRTAHHQMRR